MRAPDRPAWLTGWPVTGCLCSLALCYELSSYMKRPINVQPKVKAYYLIQMQCGEEEMGWWGAALVLTDEKINLVLKPALVISVYTGCGKCPNLIHRQQKNGK